MTFSLYSKLLSSCLLREPLCTLCKTTLDFSYLSFECRAIQRSTCNHKEGNQAECSSGENLYMLLFGALQIVVSQIPDLHNMAWLSAVAAIMSFTYASIGFALGLTKVIGKALTSK